MTIDDIIRMAREAAAKHGHTIRPTDEIVETLTSFSALVAAAEREACAKVAEDPLHGLPVWRARENIATAIRARGEK